MHVTTKTLQAEGKCGKLLHTRGFGIVGAGLPTYCANEIPCELHPVNKTNMPTLLSIIQDKMKEFDEKFPCICDMDAPEPNISCPIHGYHDFKSHYHDTIVAVLEGVETELVKSGTRGYYDLKTLASSIKKALEGMKKI